MSIEAVSNINLIELGLGVIAGSASIGCYMAFDKLSKIKKYAEITSVMAKCKNKPMGIVIDKSGKMIPFACEPNTKNKGLLEHDNYTLINPDVINCSRSKFNNGPETYFYPLPGFFPMGIQSCFALVQLAKEIRKNDTLNWIPSELIVLNLLFNGTKTLYADCRDVIESRLKFGDEIPLEFMIEKENEEEYEEEEEEEFDGVFEGEEDDEEE